MKKTKLFLLGALMFLGVGSVSAQSTSLRWGVEAGMLVNRITNYADDADNKMGFDVGVRLEVGFTPNIYLGTGLQYAMKGAKVSGHGWEAKCNPQYLQIPIHVGYRYDFNETIGIFGEFGPYIAVGVAGKDKYEVDHYKRDDDFFGDTDEGGAKRFDMGLGIHVGCEIIGHWQVALGYDFGLVNMLDEPGDKYRNGSLRLGLAYMF